MKFGENLYNLRKAAKMSQEKLAEKMEVSRQSVSKWENGESYPEMEKIMKLCEVFHCKINDLVYENMADIDSLDEDIKMSVVKFKEEKQKRIKGISKAIYILARIGKIVTTVAIPIIVFLLIVTPIFISNIELKDNTIVFKGARIDDKITITEEKSNDGVTIQLKANGVLIADAKNQDTIIQMKNVLENNSKGQIIAFLEVGFGCLIICLILYRMTLNRLEKLFININEGDTPFTLENVKYIKEMAKLMIIALILPSGGGIIFQNVLEADLDVGFELFDVVQILFLFGISYIFEYGYELQQDTKAKMYGEVSNNE
ncbi:MAG: helix-turn-helix transcriptional regulator [Clostridia bacterium]|nr:helix-turn-helix transcriptional regulator [Clostridia bacterium]